MNKNMIDVSGATLSSIDLFSDLKVKERNSIATLCRGQYYKPDELIVSHLENTRDVFFIVSGTVRVTIFSKLGKEITFRDMHAGRMFGELSAIDGKPRSAHVIAHMESTIVFKSPDEFWNLLGAYPGIAQKTLKYLMGLIRLLSDRVVELGTLGVKNRIYAELLRMGRQGELQGVKVTISPAPTHAEIATTVGTHREAVTREIGVLNRQGIVSKQGKTIIIHDIGKLEEIANDGITEVS